MLKTECVKCRKFCLCLWMALFVWSFLVRKTQQSALSETQNVRLGKASRERERAEWKCVRVVRWKAFYFRLNDLQNVSLCWWKRRPRAKLLCKPKYFNEKLSSFYIITGSLSVRRKVYALLLNQHCRHFRDLFTTVAKRIIIKNMQRLFMLKISLRLKTFARLRE